MFQQKCRGSHVCNLNIFGRDPGGRRAERSQTETKRPRSSLTWERKTESNKETKVRGSQEFGGAT